MTNAFRYLKRLPTEVSYINSLFVSSFIEYNTLTVSESSCLSKYCKTDRSIVDGFLKVISRTKGLGLEELVRLFERVVSPSDRIVNGAIYTPKPIRSVIIEHCLGGYTSRQLNTIRVCDIACGCGGFLMDVALYIQQKTGKSFKAIFCENIYGIDIQDYSVERAKILLTLLALTHGEDNLFDFNLIQADTLDFHSEEWNKDFTSFDVIVGNPPYVCSRNVTKETKIKMLRYEVSHSGHPDVYIPFFQIADEMLNEGGKLGYITMNSFLRSVNGRKLRQYLSSNLKDISIVDFRSHQVFNLQSTYTCLFFLNKGGSSDVVKYVADKQGSLEVPFDYSQIAYSSLNDKKGWNLNENTKSKRIESVGTPIGKYCASRHGIATLSNKTYIFSPKSEDDLYYYMESDGLRYPIEKAICRDIVNSNKLNSNVKFSSIIEKVIFPYDKNKDGKICVIEEEKMQSDYPGAYHYLLSKKSILALRDKGNTQSYPSWYAYGRTQSLQMPRYKLFFPKFANDTLHCVLVDNNDLLLYNGIAFVSDSEEKLLIVKKIIESKLFWNYIVNNAKPYSSDYYSLSGVDINNFGVPDFSNEEIQQLLSIRSRVEIDEWLASFY